MFITAHKYKCNEARNFSVACILILSGCLEEKWQNIVVILACLSLSKNLQSTWSACGFSSLSKEDKYCFTTFLRGCVRRIFLHRSHCDQYTCTILFKVHDHDLFFDLRLVNLITVV